MTSPQQFFAFESAPGACRSILEVEGMYCVLHLISSIIRPCLNTHGRWPYDLQKLPQAKSRYCHYQGRTGSAVPVCNRA